MNMASVYKLGVLNNSPNGLPNLGNTCFANTAIQCISQILGDHYFVTGDYSRDIGNVPIQPLGVLRDNPGYLQNLKDYLQKEFKKKIGDNIYDEAAEEFCKNFCYLITSIQNPDGQWTPHYTKVYLRRFFKMLVYFNKSDVFLDGRQHDSNDFLIFLLELLSNCMSYYVKFEIDGKEEEKLNRKDRSRLASYYAWQKEWIVKTSNNKTKYRLSSVAETLCGQFRTVIMCGNTECDNISEKFDPFFSLTLPIDKKKNILDCLKTYTITEVLDEDNKWYCDKCNQKTCATKRTMIWKTADYVVIHLKRFLHVTSHILGTYLVKDEHNVDYPMENLDLSPFVEDGNNRGEIFDLCAVAIHNGSLRRGHYVCVRKIKDQWRIFDDDRVRPIQEKEVVNTSAYYLVYKRK